MQYPVAMEAEQALLGTILIAPDRWPEARSSVSADDLYVGRHQRLWRLFEALSSHDQTPDLLTVAEVIAEDAEKYGGVAYVTSLPERIVSIEGMDRAIAAVQSSAIRRRMLKASQELQEAATSGDMPIDEALQHGEEALQALAGGAVTDRWAPLSDILDQELHAITRRTDSMDQGLSAGWPTGYRDLDRLTGGMRPGHLWIIGARPAMGKTALALNIMMSLARDGIGSAMASLEMPASQCAGRMLSAESMVDGYYIRDGIPMMGRREAYTAIMDAGERLYGYPIWIDDRRSTIQAIHSRARRLKAREPGFSVLVVDYLQLVKARSNKDQRERQVAEMAEVCKEMAKELEICVIALAQLNRQVEQRRSKQPMMSDLRESGAIEQAADVVMLLYREGYYNDAAEHPDVAALDVGKNRHGQTGRVLLHWDGPHQRFTDLDWRE